MPNGTVPTGTKLDLLVLWAVAYLNREPGYIGIADVESYVAPKVGRDPQAQLSDRESQNIRRSVGRLHDAHLISFNAEWGYRIAEVENA